MPFPLWIVAGAILFWGWQVEALVAAVPMAVMAAGPAWVSRRAQFRHEEFNRALDVCWVLFFAGLLLTYSRESVGNVLREFVQWLPVVAFPALLAQVWSEANRTPTTALIPWPSWRRRSGDSNPPLDLAPAYVPLALLSASTAGAGRVGFYAFLALIAGALLWGRRPRGVSASTLAALFVATAAGGWVVSVGLGNFQQWVENGVLEWQSRFFRDPGAGRLSQTAIGRSGRVGGSDAIVARIRDAGPRPMPSLLRISSYSSWTTGDQTWSASGLGSFEKVNGTIDEWTLESRRDVAGALEVEWARGATDGLMPLPASTITLRDLPANGMERTLLGAVRPEIKAGVISFRAEHAPSTTWEAPPTSSDSVISDRERPAIRAVVEALGGAETPLAERLDQIRRFFRSEFRYTTVLTTPRSEDPRATTPLGRFLLGSREGHCEYFATAAALMLREMGVPTRYSTGFLLSNDGPLGGSQVVRASQAHAWVRVWTGDHWIDFDPTPPTDFEAGALNGWRQPLARRWYAVRFAVARWWWLGEKTYLRQAYWLSIPLLAGLLWRFRRLRSAATTDPGGRGPHRDWPGLDSEWFQVEARLVELGCQRGLAEPLGEWGERLVASGWPEIQIRTAAAAATLHDRLRFDPLGLIASDREQLRDLTRETLTRLSAPPRSRETPRGG